MVLISAILVRFFKNRKIFKKGRNFKVMFRSRQTAYHHQWRGHFKGYPTYCCRYRKWSWKSGKTCSKVSSSAGCTRSRGERSHCRVVSFGGDQQSQRNAQSHRSRPNFRPGFHITVGTLGYSGYTPNKGMKSFEKKGQIREFSEIPPFADFENWVN